MLNGMLDGGFTLRNKYKFLLVLLFLAISSVFFIGCEASNKEDISKENKIQATSAEDNTENKTLILATTTSTENSGLLDFILPDFEKNTGIKVKVVAVGTGQALTMGKDGEADVLLVHAKASEEEFVKEGHGTKRNDVMYNDFVLVGPKDDPAKLKELSSKDIANALKLIKDGGYTFISRGDDSGTHKKELELWKLNNISPEGNWYVSTGQGMGATLQIASEKLGYTLTDRATYLSMKENLELEVIVEGDNKLFNQYGVIPVNPNKNDKINSDGANKFVQWILSEETQKLISEFGKDKFGQSLFIPNGNSN